MKKLETFERAWNAVEDAILGVTISIALLLVCLEVVFRYFFPYLLPDWGSEIIMYLVITAILFSGGQLILMRRHIRADLFVRTLPLCGRKWIEFFILAMGFSYCAIITWFSVEVVQFAHMIDIRSHSSLQFKQWIFYLVLPLAFGMMTIRYLIQLYRFIAEFSPDMLPGYENDDQIIKKTQIR